jgi:hypothetical protein
MTDALTVAIWTVWIAGGILGAAVAAVAFWLGACWWFGDRDLFKGVFTKQEAAHRAGDEKTEPEFVAPSLIIPANLFPPRHPPMNSGDRRGSAPPTDHPALSPVEDSETVTAVPHDRHPHKPCG